MSTVIDNERFRKLLRSYPKKAVTLLHDLYHQDLQKLSYSLTHNIEDAQDIVQESFYHLWKISLQLTDYHEKSIQHYLTKIVRYKSITHYRRNIRLNLDKLKFSNGQARITTQNAFENTLIEAEIIEDVRRVIENFPPRERECFLLRADTDMTIAQIADSLKISIKAVEKNLTKARKRLRHYLNEKA
ncbi:RNA polymerase sigma factor [Chryseolinea soli]|uniref:Sigma-70 family RNA polymerase sigma factor n=1 Tax=Chryseolinea soli TaxID=2321403 RepID=A0A385SMG7_9BACT|nr:sigma-70 family RNA polymerase sigma factor [Chryseolinea soli]AYB32032.1 sigma-70 family RNA polymerase sigma factor [Chryseolinea soli]